MTTPTRAPAPHARMTAKDRAKFGRELKRQYKAGASIRTLAAETGRSYGNIRGILAEVETKFRPRGTAAKKK